MLLNPQNRNSKTARAVADHWDKSLNAREWFEVRNTGNDSAEIRIYDVIGWPFIDADMFVRELDRIDSNHITVAINSPGGDVFDGTAIFNALRNHPAKITTRIDGIAASMASVIALAGDNVEMASNASFMIHNPWTFSMGDEHALRKDADLLGRFGSTLAETYVAKTGKSMEEIKAAMDEESWYIGAEAEAFGFTDHTTGEGEPVSARFNTGIFSHAPKNILNGGPEGDKPTPSEREIERVLTRDAGLTRSAARALIAGGYRSSIMPGADDVTELVSSVQTINETFKRNMQ